MEGRRASYSSSKGWGHGGESCRLGEDVHLQQCHERPMGHAAGSCKDGVAQRAATMLLDSMAQVKG